MSNFALYQSPHYYHSNIIDAVKHMRSQIKISEINEQVDIAYPATDQATNAPSDAIDSTFSTLDVE